VLLAQGSKIRKEQAPPIRVFGRGHRIACHIAPEDLERMEPVIVFAGQEAADRGSAVVIQAPQPRAHPPERLPEMLSI
jgi:hypothetical protein